MLVFGMIRILFLAVMCLCIDNAAMAAANHTNTAETSAPYMSEHPPRKLVLIIGNYKYPHLGDLPGVESDITNVKDRFEQLGFDLIDVHSNVRTWDEFDHDILKPFRHKIERDDLAVVYFSGHGFSYGGYQYFAPSDMSLPLIKGKVSTTAIPVEAVIDALGREGPGAVLLIVDACRTVANFKVVDKDGNTLPKGEDQDQRPQSTTNYVMALSVTNGNPSEGSSNPNEMSTYTKALVGRILEEKTFHSIHQDVEGDVLDATDDHQVPIQIQSSRTDIVLKITEDWHGAERELWSSLLKDGDRTRINQFVRRKTLNPYVRDARKWLEDHPQDQKPVPRLTAVSPLGVDAAWRLSQNVEGLSSVVSFPPSMPFEQRKMSVEDIVKRYGIQPRTGPSRPTAEALASWSEQLTRYEGLAFNQTSAVYAEPRDDSELVAQADRGSPAPFDSVALNEPARTKVVTDVVAKTVCVQILTQQVCNDVPELVSKVEPDPTWIPRSWTSMAVGPAKMAGYVPIDADNTAYDVDIGKPFKELTVKQRETAPTGLVDQKPILESLQQAKTEGKSVSWVSIAAPVSNDADGEAADIGFMISNVSYLLNNNGISRDHITSVIGDPDVGNETLRIRFYAQ